MDMKIHRAAAFGAKIGVHKNTVKAWSLMAVVDSFAARLPGLCRYRKQIREAASDG